VRNRVGTEKNFKKKRSFVAPTRRRRPLVSVDHRVGLPAAAVFSIEEEEEKGERRKLLFSLRKRRERKTMEK